MSDLSPQPACCEFVCVACHKFTKFYLPPPSLCDGGRIFKICLHCRARGYLYADCSGCSAPVALTSLNPEVLAAVHCPPCASERQRMESESGSERGVATRLTLYLIPIPCGSGLSKGDTAT